MKIGDIVRYCKPLKGKHEWIGVVMDIEKGWLWVKVHWHDGLQRWEAGHLLEVVNEDR
tara:strand:+ start:1143 stop:1316 length:174 start_codon:yes stop_codon:yes gene_type:complete